MTAAFRPIHPKKLCIHSLVVYFVLVFKSIYAFIIVLTQIVQADDPLRGSKPIEGRSPLGGEAHFGMVGVGKVWGRGRGVGREAVERSMVREIFTLFRLCEKIDFGKANFFGNPIFRPRFSHGGGRVE